MTRIILLALMFALPSLACAAWRTDAATQILDAAGDSRLLVLGEMHGTREIPELIEMLAERYSAQEPLLLALEMERTEHAALARYMASDGAIAASDALRQRPYWSIADASNDGRRSNEMLGLIEHLRALRTAGRDVAIAPYDIARGSGAGTEDRERRMASYLRHAYASLPRGRMLVLTGNVHAMLQPLVLPGLGTTMEPMTYHLRDLQPFSIKISANAGEIWGCRRQHACGPLSHVDSGTSGAWRGETGRYHYQVVVPGFTAATLSGAR